VALSSNDQIARLQQRILDLEASEKAARLAAEAEHAAAEVARESAARAWRVSATTHSERRNP
jgi:hypothetical protein